MTNNTAADPVQNAAMAAIQQAITDLRRTEWVAPYPATYREPGNPSEVLALLPSAINALEAIHAAARESHTGVF